VLQYELKAVGAKCMKLSNTVSIDIVILEGCYYSITYFYFTLRSIFLKSWGKNGLRYCNVSINI